MVVVEFLVVKYDVYYDFVSEVIIIVGVIGGIYIVLILIFNFGDEVLILILIFLLYIVIVKLFGVILVFMDILDNGFVLLFD